MVGHKIFSVLNDFHGKQFTMENTIPKLVFRCLVRCKKNERESKEIVRGVYKRDKENSFPFILKGKWFSIIERVILPQGKMILHSFANQTM